MCGICGFYGWEDKDLIKRMAKSLEHRGPDAFGFYIGKNICLGHRRLSIIDLSEKANQPMHNEDGSIQVVFNGEIYNFKELRKELEKKGHRFISNSDTEVLVHGYEEYGESLASYLNGDFAFAVYDSNKNQLYCARDYAGIKPFYYVFENGMFSFASEIKSLLEDKDLKREIDYESFYNYLTFRYVPNEKTIFSGIKKLLPAHYLIVKDRKISIKRYWDYSFNPQKKGKSYYSDKLFEELKESVKLRLMSDVPLGSYLSGGLDSSFVVGLMSNLIDEPIKTFSVGFSDNKDFDETKYAKLVAEHFNTDHHTLYTDSSSIKYLPKVLYYMDEPIADAASVPTFLLSEFAKKKVTVVMTGEGADEVFGGYSKYKYLKMKHQYNKLPHLIRSKIAPKILKKFSNSDFSSRMIEFSKSSSFAESYLSLISFFSSKEKESLLSDELKQNYLQKYALQNPSIDTINSLYDSKKTLLQNYLYIDFNTWLPHDVLTKVDKMTMSHSVEARVPFLDKKFLELCLKIPDKYKLHYLTEKYIMRKSMKKIIPKEIIKRKKHGFNVPIQHWLEHELRPITLELLSEKNLSHHGFYNHLSIRKMISNYSNNRRYYSRQIWLLLNFEIWYKIYIEGTSYKKIKI